MILQKIIQLWLKMIELIDLFLKEKNLSENTEKAYRYDLNQFLETISHKLSDDKLLLYQKKMAPLSLSAKKRKYSTVNQFLLFLYQKHYYPDYLKLTEKIKLVSDSQCPAELDSTLCYQESPYQEGQLIALLILELGLLPNEMANLKVTDFDLNFQVLTIRNHKNVRVLPLPSQMIPYLENILDASHTYLFDHMDHVFSRQWYFNKLRQFLESLNLADLSAQKLREQFIIKEKNAGKSMLELSQILGLKSPITLEKYYRH